MVTTNCSTNLRNRISVGDKVTSEVHKRFTLKLSRRKLILSTCREEQIFSTDERCTFARLFSHCTFPQPLLLL